jgi:hypothetical protein
MAGISRDLAKKMYQSSLNYTDAMYHQIANKSVWNIIMEKYPRLSEFFLTGRGKSNLTVLERSLLEFIKQSEFIKPYKDGNYPEREYEYPPVGAEEGTNPSPGDPVITPGEEEPEEEPPPWHVVCDADHDGCWCRNGAEQELTITATYPIVAVIQVFGHAKFIAEEGQGTNTVKGKIFGSDKDIASVNWEICMAHENGQCCSNIIIYECPEHECCPDDTTLQCHPQNPVSVLSTGQVHLEVIGGVAPFTLTISGDATWEDGTTAERTPVFSRGTSIVTNASCGAASVTWTDVCGNTVTCTVRIADGCWCGTSCGSGWIEGECNCGQADGGNCGFSACNRIIAECYQQDDVSNDWFNSSFCSTAECNICNNYTPDACIPPDHGRGGNYTFCFNSCYQSAGKMCDYYKGNCDPDTYPEPNGQGRYCYKHTVGYPRYREWLCTDVCEPP